MTLHGLTQYENNPGRPVGKPYQLLNLGTNPQVRSVSNKEKIILILCHLLLLTLRTEVKMIFYLFRPQKSFEVIDIPETSSVTEYTS